MTSAWPQSVSASVVSVVLEFARAGADLNAVVFHGSLRTKVPAVARGNQPDHVNAEAGAARCPLRPRERARS